MFFLYFSVRMNNYEKTFMEDIKKKKKRMMLFLMYVGHAISFLLYNAELLAEINMVIVQIIYHINVLQCAWV